MKLKIISSKRTSINTIDDTIKISVPDLSLLKNKIYVFLKKIINGRII